MGQTLLKRALKSRPTEMSHVGRESSGFLLENTAERVIRQIRCSLLVVKAAQFCFAQLLPDLNHRPGGSFAPQHIDNLSIAD